MTKLYSQEVDDEAWDGEESHHEGTGNDASEVELEGPAEMGASPVVLVALSEVPLDGVARDAETN